MLDLTLVHLQDGIDEHSVLVIVGHWRAAEEDVVALDVPDIGGVLASLAVAVQHFQVSAEDSDHRTM